MQPILQLGVLDCANTDEIKLLELETKIRKIVKIIFLKQDGFILWKNAYQNNIPRDNVLCKKIETNREKFPTTESSSSIEICYNWTGVKHHILKNLNKKYENKELNSTEGQLWLKFKNTLKKIEDPPMVSF